MMKAIVALILFPLSMESAMAEDTHALALDVSEKADLVEVLLRANSPHAQTVEYTLEVTGNSSSTHRGKTALQANTPAVLTTVRTAKNESWCARLVVTEQGREPYELTRGSC